MCDKPSPFLPPFIGEGEIAKVADTLRSDWISTGPRVKSFEQEFAVFLGARAALRAAVKEIDVNQPVVNVRTMEDNMASTAAEPRFRTWLLGIFAALALVLSAVGVYGVMSYSVNQRTNEIGIRMALGAQAPDVFRIIVGHGGGLALAGVVISLAAALALGHILQRFLYGVTSADPVTLGAVALLLASVGLLASYVPARRAMRLDPMAALRYE